MDRQAWWLFCIIILLSPITLMEAPPSYVLLFDILSLTAGLLAITHKRTAVGESFLLLLTLPSLLISLYFAFQIIPLAPIILQLLVPETWSAYQDSIWKLLPDIWMPIAIDVESTLLAWYHMAALWVFCVAFGFLVDSHLRLLQFAQFIVLSVAIWSGLIITTLVTGNSPWDIIPWLDISRERFVANLVVWIVAFIPLIIAAHAACKISSHRPSLKKKINNFIKSPEIPQQICFTFGLFLAFSSLILLFVPFLWLTVFTGYLLFLSFRPVRVGEQRFIYNKNICFIASLCTFGLMVWIFLSPPALFSDFNNPIDWNLSWLGYGLGAHANLPTPGETGWSGENIAVMGGGLAEFWTGLGSIGSILVIGVILALYRGVGGRKSIDQNDTITKNLHSGCIAGIILLIITGSSAFWKWQSLFVCLIYLVLVATWCRRLNSVANPGVNHNISRWSILGFRALVCLLLVAGGTVGIIKMGATFVDRQDGSMELNIYELLNAEDSEPWMRTLVSTLQYDSDFSLSLGLKYLLQKRDQEAEEAILSAFRRRPLSPQVHVAVASLRACQGDQSSSRYFFLTRAAENYTPDNITKLLIARLLALPDQEAALSLINLTLEHSPKLASLYLNLMTLYGYDPLELKPLLPEQPLVMLALGDLLLSAGHVEEAENAYWSAVYNKSNNSVRDVYLYKRVASYFSETNRISEAIIAVEEGLKVYPKSANLKSLLEELQLRSRGAPN